LSQSDWADLSAAYDPITFNSLDSVIGCPDCADGGAEWVTVETEGKDRKVLFEYGKGLQGLEGFLFRLHRLNYQGRSEAFCAFAAQGDFGMAAGSVQA